MEVKVAQGSWKHGSILSLRVGEVRRQVVLQCDTSISIAKAPADVEHMQVDVFTRVASTRFSIEPGQEIYKLPRGEGVSDLALRIRPQPTDGESEAELEHYQFQVDTCESGQSNVSHLSPTAMERMRNRATEYIHRFGLRDVLQELFKSVLREMPDDPFRFMMVFLRDRAVKEGHANNQQDTSDRLQESPTSEVGRQRQNGEDDSNLLIESGGDQVSDRNGWRQLQQQYEERIESQQVQILLLEQRLQDFEVLASASAARDAEEAAWHAERERMHMKQLEAEHAWQDRNDLLQRQVDELEERLSANAVKLEMASQTELGLIDLVKKVESQQSRINQLECELARSAAASPSAAAGLASTHGRATPADEAAGAAEIRTEYRQDIGAPQRALQQGWVAADVSGLGRSNLTGSLAAASLSSSEVNTHMLSKLLASTYAPPVEPTSHYEPREDLEQDLAQLGQTQPHPELLVEVVDCMDKATNGIFACVGSCNGRPLYRLLGLQPRYLYYSKDDIAWAGWWISDKTGSENYVEWFKDPADARLPVYCRKGELGSRVVEAPLTSETLKKLSQISNQAEKSTIRSMLTEAFGARFVKLDGSQRGLMSKTSPVVAVAHTMEAQQRALQLLHSQLSAETQRREAAEAHAATMEEAFEMLQLRLQAKMPGPPCLASSEKPAPSPLSPVSTEAPQSSADLCSLSISPSITSP